MTPARCLFRRQYSRPDEEAGRYFANWISKGLDGHLLPFCECVNHELAWAAIRVQRGIPRHASVVAAQDPFRGVGVATTAKQCQYANAQQSL